MRSIPTTKQKQDAQHILKGGRMLQGITLKRGTYLFPRRGNAFSGQSIRFDAFTADGRVRVIRNGKRVTMTRKSLAGNYEI